VLFAARNTQIDAAWLPNRTAAVALVTTNLESLKALGVGARSRRLELEGTENDILAYKGGDVCDLESKVVGVTSSNARLHVVRLVANTCAFNVTATNHWHGQYRAFENIVS